MAETALPGAIAPQSAPAHRRGLMLVGLAALIWSTGGLIVRSLEAADPWTTVFWRSLFAAAFLILFLLVRDRGRAPGLFLAMGWPGVVVGLCFTTASIGLVVALSLTTVAHTLIILSTAPLLAALIARVWLGERVRPRGWITMAIALVGVVVMVSESILEPEAAGAGSLAGDLVACIIPLSTAVATVTIRRYHAVRMVPATCLGVLVAAAIALPLSSRLAVTSGDFGLLFVFGALQLGAGMALFVTGARLAPAAEVALVSMLEPILGPFWVWAVVGEHPGTAGIVGGALVMGALLVNTTLDLVQTRRRAAA